MTALLEAVQVVARLAGEVALRHYRTALAVETKGDGSPVTLADREAEQAARSWIAERFPDDGILGEEFGEAAGTSGRLWILDPIDGTKSFVRGYPMFSTQIALMHRGELVLGVSHASAAGEIAWARRGGGAWLNGVRCRVSDIADWSRATLSTGNLKTLARGSGWQRLASLVEGAHRTRGYGDYYHYHLLASGRLDCVLESDVNILDIAALAVIVREAGGVFTDLAGCEVGLATTSVLAGTPAMHAHALARLRS